MKVKFKGPVAVDGVDYNAGEHEFADSYASHWYILALIANGKALVTDLPKSIEESGEVETKGGPISAAELPGEVVPVVIVPEEKLKKSPKAPKVNGETKYERAKRIKGEKKAKLEAAAAGTQEG